MHVGSEDRDCTLQRLAADWHTMLVVVLTMIKMVVMTMMTMMPKVCR